MRAPANAPIVNKLPAASASARNRLAKSKAARGVLTLFVFLSGFVLWPLYFLFAVALALWRMRSLLFPFHVRVNRRHFWSILLLYVLLGFLLFAMIQGAVEAGMPRIAGIVLDGLLGSRIVLSLAAIAIGRLHDRDASGWWVLFYCGIPAAAAVVVFFFGDLPSPLINSCTVGLTGLALWAVFALGYQDGTAGPNRFGPESSWYRGAAGRSPSPPNQPNAARQP
jgi:uncharacterized membrane protein YhaH (DUF805 family)